MRTLLLLLVAITIFGCNDNSTQVIVNRMVISPKVLTYQSGETTKTLSITHTCTCPFNWTVAVLPPNGVLKDTTGTWDNTSVPIHIDRSKLMVDTLQTMLRISSAFGVDTVRVTIIK